jgi:hypothetical protein
LAASMICGTACSNSSIELIVRDSGAIVPPYRATKSYELASGRRLRSAS